VAGNQDNMPTLYLPEGRPIRFIETSKDVIHSFWIVDFLFKRDVIPGRVNQFELTPNRVGTYVGRCAELCGVYHDRMNFRVVVMKSADFEAKLASMKASRQFKTDSDAGTNPTGDQGGSNSNTPNATYNTDPTGQTSHTIGSSP
jgi:cytochrome c oxidase subunit 2